MPCLDASLLSRKYFAFVVDMRAGLWECSPIESEYRLKLGEDTQQNMTKGSIVKYSKPEPGEEDFRFILLDDPQEVIDHSKLCDMTPRVDIELICNEYIRPISIVELTEICLA